MRILLLTSCVRSKKYRISDIKSVLDEHHLPLPMCDVENEEKYREVLKNFILPANKMYQGSFNFVKELANQLRRRGDDVDFFIISARYGLINESTSIIPYECTFRRLKKGEIRKQAEKLKIYENLIRVLKGQNYDQTIIVLGEDYLLTVFDKAEGKNFFQKLKSRELIVFGSSESKDQIGGPQENLRFVQVRGLGDRNKRLKEFTRKLMQCNS